MALAVLVAGAALPMRAVRNRSMAHLPVTRRLLKKAGVFPLRNHYYEPLFDPSSLKNGDLARNLPGIDFAIDEQLSLLRCFETNAIPGDIPREQQSVASFHMNNGVFESGDADIWFHVIRHFKPARIIEIGSGNSTKMARLAIATVQAQDSTYRCDHTCIEPYEMPWLEQIDGIRVIRQKLEDVDPSLFDALQNNDILFVDSSHMIRPQGDVLKAFLQIIPTLESGVIVHVHDIFSPRDYPQAWLEIPRFWNEQYLLEAFLINNMSWEVMLSLNLLKHDFYPDLKRVCPYIDENREPGSFYIRRRHDPSIVS